MLESSNFVYRYRLYQVISLTIANYPQVGVVRSRASVFNCGTPIIYRLERVKLGIPNLVYTLTFTSTSAHMIDYPQRGMSSESRDLFKLWRMSDNISKTIQDRDIVTTED